MEKKEKKQKKEKTSQGKQLDVRKLKNYFNKKTFGGIALVGICVIVMLYVFIYLDYTQRTEELTASNAEIKAVVDELQEYADNMQMYQNAISEMETQIKDMLGEYPADAREEDILMLAVQIQKNNDIAYNSIAMEETDMEYDIPSTLVSQVGVEDFNSDIVFRQKHATYVNVTDYNNLKSVIQEIYASPNRIGIDNISYAKNEEDGTLEGSVSLYFYSASGTGKEYAAPDIAEYLAGTSDMFQTGTPRKADEEIGEENEQEDEQENAQEQAAQNN